MFIIAGMIHFCGVIFYALFASGELQPWAEPLAIAGGVAPAPGAPGPLVPGQTVIGPAGVGIADPNMMQQQGWSNATGAGVNPFAQPNGTATYASQQPSNPYGTAVDPSQQYQQSWNATTADPVQAAQATWN